MKNLILFLLLTSSVVASAQNFKFGKVSEEELLEKEHPMYPEANAAILYSYQRTSYKYNKSTGFSLVTEIRQRIKIYNNDGFDWASKVIDVYGGAKDESVNGIKAVTYNLKNGKIEEEKLDRDDIFREESSKYTNTTKFTMPAIQAGSVIEFEYSIRSPYLGAIDPIQLQYTIPLNSIDISVSIPEYLVFKVHNNPKAPFYVDINKSSSAFKYTSTNNVKRGSGFRQSTQMVNSSIEFSQNVYEINQENIPPLREEAHVDYLNNYAAYLRWELQYTNFPQTPIEYFSQDWNAVASSIYKDGGYDSELKNTSIFSKDLDQLLANVSDPIQKMSMIYYFLKQKVRWNGFTGIYPENGIKKAYKEGVGNTGDLNLLLTAMLSYAKLDANPILLSTQDHGIPVFPTRNGFNYVISGVKINNDFVLLDATDPTASVGELPKRARNWQGRLIKSNGASEWVNLQPANKSEMLANLNVQFSEDKLTGKYTRIYKGLFAKNFREKFMSGEEDDYQTVLTEGKGGISINDIKIENLKKFGSEIKESYAFELSNGAEIINDNIYLKPLLFQTTSENPFKADDRYYPIFFQYPSTNNKTTNFMIPKGYKVTSLPEDIIVKLKDEAGEFRYLVRHQGNIIRVSSEVNINHTVFNPQDFEFLKSFYANIVEKQNEAIVLTKIEKNGPEKSTAGGR